MTKLMPKRTLSAFILASAEFATAETSTLTEISGSLLLLHAHNKEDNGAKYMPVPEAIAELQIGACKIEATGNIMSEEPLNYNDLKHDRVLLTCKSGDMSLSIGQIGYNGITFTDWNTPEYRGFMPSEGRISQAFSVNKNFMGAIAKTNGNLTENWTYHAELTTYNSANIDQNPTSHFNDRGNSTKPSGAYKFEATNDNSNTTIGSEGFLVQNGVLGDKAEVTTSIFGKRNFTFNDSTQLTLKSQYFDTDNLGNTANEKKNIGTLSAQISYSPTIAPDLTLWGYLSAYKQPQTPFTKFGEIGAKYSVDFSNDSNASIYIAREMPLTNTSNHTGTTQIGGHYSISF